MAVFSDARLATFSTLPEPIVMPVPLVAVD